MTKKSNNDITENVSGNASRADQSPQHEKVDEILERLSKDKGASTGVSSEREVNEVNKKQNLKYWFWGTIAALIVSSILLTIMAHFNTGPKQVVLEESGSTEAVQDPKNTLPKELSPSEIREIFNNAYQPALESALARADKLIDSAYQPVYRKIPAYTEWHYSVWGSYVELGTAAVDSPEKLLEEKLLSGLSDRLSAIPKQVVLEFSATFERGLNVQLDDFEANDRKIGPLTQTILNDAALQTGTSVLVVVGGGTFGQALSALIIKKVGAKIALKMGSKWWLAIVGAGGSVILCSWAGPFAAVCGVGGGIATFFGVDFGMNYIDKIFNSDEFMTALRAEIDASKQEQKEYFRDQIEQMVTQQKFSTGYQLQDFTLKQLSKANRESVCSATVKMIDQYEKLQNDLSYRSDENLLNLLKEAEAIISNSNMGLFEISQEIATNLNNFENVISVTPTVLSGLLPSEHEANRKVSGSVKINNVNYILNKSSPNSNFLNVSVIEEDKNNEVNLTDKHTLRIKAELEQHLYLQNKYFVGNAEIERGEFLQMGALNVKEIRVPFQLKDTTASNASFPLFVRFKVQAEELAHLKMKPDCAN